MSSLIKTIRPKSNQLNADDLIGSAPITIKITKVVIEAGDQPVSIHYADDKGKPYKPSKGMRRVLVQVWGPDSIAYIGRSLTLYRDEKVRFGADIVGGLRISHMSNIERPITLALTMSKSSRKPFTVKPLTDTSAGFPSGSGEGVQTQAALNSARAGETHDNAKDGDPLTFPWIDSAGNTQKFSTIEAWQEYVIKGIWKARDANSLNKSFERNGTITHELRLAGYSESLDKVLGELALKMQNFNPINAG